MQTELTKTIAELKSSGSIGAFDEASTKAAVVLRLLSVLGWNPFDVEEVKPEYTIGSQRVDYSLRIGNMNKVFIEVKRIAENLEVHQEQLLRYSFQEGVKLSILTNGVTWWFYLPLSEGSWEERRFYTIDILEQEPSDISERFIEFLSKRNIDSGQAFENAEKVYKGQQKKAAMKAALPRAWHKIIRDPDDLLVELLIETTEKLSGFRPEVADVEKFLTNVDGSYTDTPSTRIKDVHLPSPAPPTRGLPLSDNYINRTIDSFVFLGETYRPRTWQDLVVTVASKLYEQNKDSYQRCLSLRGSKMLYFSTDSSLLKYPKQIAGSKYFVETKLNANSIVRRSRELMGLFGYKNEDLKIFVKS